MIEMSSFARGVYESRYAWNVGGRKEVWAETARRVSSNVFAAVGAPKSLVDECTRLITERKFIPGGRYLASAGREAGTRYVNNCFDGATRVVTRQGTRTLREIESEGTPAKLMTTDGVWVDAIVEMFGTQEIWKVTVSRCGVKKEIFATAGHSWRVVRRSKKGRKKTSTITLELSAGDKLWSTFGRGPGRLPLSPAGIQHGIVFGDGCAPEGQPAHVRLCGEKDAQLVKHFPGYRTRPVDGDVMVCGLPSLYKDSVSLRADRSYLWGWLAGYFAADGCVSEEGIVSIASTERSNLERVKDVCYILGVGAAGIRFQDRISNLTGAPSRLYVLNLFRDKLTEDFFLVAKHRERFVEAGPARRPADWTVVSVEPTERIEEVFCAVVPDTHEFVLEDNILTGNCYMMRAEDTREGWGKLLERVAVASMTGGGVGVYYGDLRGNGAPLRRMGGTSSGPLALMQAVNEVGRAAVAGGSRRAALWAGLPWNHPDILSFISMKDWIPEVRALKDRLYGFPATMDGTNISVCLDDAFFAAYAAGDTLAREVFWRTLRSACNSGEPGFSVDVGENTGEVLRNPCTEISSRDDSDVCCIGSVNLARIYSAADTNAAVEVGTAFLVAGTVYSDVPYAEVAVTREKNRRIGLGLMGVHEFVARRGHRYGERSNALTVFGGAYVRSGILADDYADAWGLSRPVKTRAIAPTGTIGIIAETTTGIEPVFAAAYKRRYLDRGTYRQQYVVDPTAKRMHRDGIDVEDAYTIDTERRIAFQAEMQAYVDHGISSTVNLPAWGSEKNNEDTVRPLGEMLLRYLPRLRGVTFYPDGARGGQPIVPVPLAEALAREGEVIEETVDVCSLANRGACGA